MPKPRELRPHQSRSVTRILIGLISLCTRPPAGEAMAQSLGNADGQSQEAAPRPWVRRSAGRAARRRDPRAPSTEPPVSETRSSGRTAHAPSSSSSIHIRAAEAIEGGRCRMFPAGNTGSHGGAITVLAWAIRLCRKIRSAVLPQRPGKLALPFARTD